MAAAFLQAALDASLGAKIPQHNVILALGLALGNLFAAHILHRGMEGQRPELSNHGIGIFRFFHQQGGVHNARAADAPGQAAGIQPAQPGDAFPAQILIQGALAAEIAGIVAPLPHHIRAQARPGAFKVLWNYAIIADGREGLNHDLPFIAGIGDGFQVTGHGGGKHQLRINVLFRAKPGPLKELPIGQQ